jgi:REP element-mobilizing transposase RayT
MGQLRRRQLPDGYFHVTARGVHGTDIFLVDLDRFDFIALLDKASARHGIRVFARCLMDTHYHLIVDAEVPKLSAAMHELNGKYALRFNQRHGRRGHLFGKRFSSWVIEDDDHFHAAIEYVVNNPATAGPRARHNERWTKVDLDQLRS